MNGKKVLLNNLVMCKKNIKRKVLDMKRGVIDSSNYFLETFKPIIDPLNTIIENKNNNNTPPIKNIKNDESHSDGNEEDYSDFTHFLQSSPLSRSYDKTFGLHYDVKDNKLKIAETPVTIINDNLQVQNKYYPWTLGLWSLLCEKVPRHQKSNDYEAYYEILKSTKVHLKQDGKPKANKHYKWVHIVKPLYERMVKESNNLNKENTKLNISEFDVNKTNKRNKSLSDLEFQNKKFKHSQSKEKLNLSKSFNDLLFENDPFTRLPQSFDDIHSSTDTGKNLINFDETLKSDQIGSSLYKSVIPNTQIVYYDDPNELITRLNLLISSQNAGNTGVKNEIISILEELRERKLIE